MSHSSEALSADQPLAQSIQQHLSEFFRGDQISVVGDGQHFFATIISDQFEGKSRIARHQLVYKALGERMKQEIHALSIKAFSKQENATH